MTGVMWGGNWMKWGAYQLAAREYYYIDIIFSYIHELLRISTHFLSSTLSEFFLSSFIDLKSHSPSMTPSF